MGELFTWVFTLELVGAIGGITPMHDGPQGWAADTFTIM